MSDPIMQNDDVESGYFSNRKTAFDAAIRKGIGNNPKPRQEKPAKRKPAAKAPVGEKAVKKAVAEKPETSAPFGGGPKDLSKLPPGLQKYWKNKRKGGK